MVTKGDVALIALVQQHQQHSGGKCLLVASATWLSPSHQVQAARDLSMDASNLHLLHPSLWQHQDSREEAATGRGEGLQLLGPEAW